MTPERYNQIVEVFLEASQRNVDTRGKFIAAVCHGDDELRREVEAMLASDEQSQQFLDKFPNDVATELLAGRGVSIVGQQLGEYKVIELLGKGGMGEVFLAQDTRLGRRAALKILPEEYTVDSMWLRRFEREARAIAALNHPNIITIYGVGQAGSINFLATEFVEGETLRAMMNAGPVQSAIVVEIAIQAASALGAAHTAGIIHRDIKPENMILRPDGLLKILDFGIAMRTEQPAASSQITPREKFKSLPGLIVGTPRYMSPEQAKGLAVDARTDVFSLGCVLYELLTGHPAMPADMPTGVLAAILSKRPTPLESNCPAALARAIVRAIEKDPDKRYHTAQEMLSDLRTAKRELESSYSRPASTRRHFVTASVVALAALILVASVAVLHLRAPGESIKSIAVLPFVNEGGADLEFLADGLTDSLIGDLSQVPNLKVISRDSVFRYKGRQVDAALSGAMLKAQMVLLGRVSQRGDRLSVRLELVDVRDNHRVWGEQYNRVWADLLQMQMEISREVLSKLRLTLSGRTERQLVQRQKVSPEGYQLYLKGNFFLFQQGAESDLNSAIMYFHGALNKDPNYALAYVGLANSYVVLADYVSPKEAMPKAREYALKALEMGGAPAEAHVVLGLVKLLYDWDWLGAEREFKNDSVLNPNAVDTFSCYLHYADILGRTNESVATLTRLLVRDPMSPWDNEELACVSYYARRYDKAIAQYRRTISINPAFPPAYVNAGRAYVQKQMYPEALAELEKGRRIDPNFLLIIAELGYTWAVSGNKVAARNILEDLNRQAAHRYVDAYGIAVIYLGLAEPEKTFAYLEKAYAERSTSIPWLKVEPRFDPVRSDPRYLDLLRRVGLTR
jgi:serine/threonine protein kinase/tetratricopeptide (TPR) repeat protein